MESATNSLKIRLKTMRTNTLHFFSTIHLNMILLPRPLDHGLLKFWKKLYLTNISRERPTYFTVLKIKTKKSINVGKKCQKMCDSNSPTECFKLISEKYLMTIEILFMLKTIAFLKSTTHPLLKSTNSKES